MHMAWRLGIDLGTNSLGWWAFEVKPDGDRWQVEASLDGGVYIFPEGREPAKSGRVGDSNAVRRRLARGMRRNRDRRKARLGALMRELVQLGLMPEPGEHRDKLFQTQANAADPDRFNPYRLRAEALERTLEPNELGRALFHLALRRGFKSNRAEQSDDEGGLLKERMDELRDALGGKSLGQFLWKRLKEAGPSGPAEGIRFRGRQQLYPDRSMCAAEFDAIRARQAPHHRLKPEDWDRLRNRYVLFQWPLRPVERGRCEFHLEEPRHWRDTPIGHDFRIHQELNALKWRDGKLVEHPLDARQRSAVLDLLLTRKSEVKFDPLRKRKRSDGSPLFPGCIRFSHEDAKRKGLKNHRIARLLSDNAVLAPLWQRRCAGDGGRLDDIFTVLLEEPDPETLESRLAEGFGLMPAVIEALADLRLSRETASVSRRFMEEIVPIMRDQGLMYWDAVSELRDENGHPLRHSPRPGAGDREVLPYYGEILQGSMSARDPAADPARQPELHFGKIANPTVHIALNSLRRVVNRLIARFGEAPVEIHVELSRDLKRSRRQRNEIVARQARDERENRRIRAELAAHGEPNPSARDIKKVKLWEELGETELTRRCPFSGEVISFSRLLNGDAEIEHILPFSRTLDDSMANLTVAMRWANRRKGNDTPYEAFATDAHATAGIRWETVSAIAQRLPAYKAWRFGPDAMDRFEGEHEFIARQLTDNAYIARSTVRYLRCLKGVEQIVPNRGGLTSLLRGKWRLNGILSDDNRKSREDHRHHAIDAAVIALADRAVLSAVSRQTARGADDRVRIEAPDLPAHLENGIRQRAPEIIVAFKPDHGWQGPMFKETAYGFVDPDRRDPCLPEHNLVTRKPLADLNANEYACIRDTAIREKVQDRLEHAAGTGEDPRQALVRFAEEHGIRSVRILVKDQTVEPRRGAPYKGYKPDSYVCCDIWRLPVGKPGRWKQATYRWKGVYWSYADAAGGMPEPETRKPHPAAKFVSRLHKDDMIAYEDGGKTQVMRVAGFSTTNNKLDVVPHFLADPKRNYASINVLGAKNLRKLRVAPDGKVKGLRK